MDNNQAIRDLFDRASDLPAALRPAFLIAECPDAIVKARVEALLRASELAGDFLSTPAVSVASANVLGQEFRDAGTGDPLVGSRLGAYAIQSVIGHGGMGVVYRAEQENPARTVALKVIRWSMPTAQLLRRFEHEAAILGRLRHPGIAQVYEAGTARGPDGRDVPYFAMELVLGTPLLAFAAAQSLNTRAKLGLFALVCDAVQHAHQKGVVHRDLKPANILVELDTDATLSGANAGLGPKVLDFGVARLMESDIALTTMQTDTGQILGTLPYMSPEQVRGESEHIDTRSDVYALGVVLYELLSGALPYDVKGKPITHAAAMICGDEPGSLPGHDARLGGDIETIVLKALEKDPLRRYQSAGDLAADVRRHLADQPIIARPATGMYQLRKFVRRNRALVVGVVASFVLLCAGIVGTGVGLVRANRARDTAALREREAKTAADRAQHTVKFLTSMLGSIDPQVGGDKGVTVLQVLDGAADGMATELAGQPEVEIEARLTLARSYSRLSAFDKALAVIGPAMNLVERLHPGGSADEARVLSVLAEIALSQRKPDEAVEYATRCLGLCKRFMPGDAAALAGAYATLGGAYAVAEQYTPAMEPLREAVQIYGAHPELHGQDSIDASILYASAISNSGAQGAGLTARDLYARAMEQQRALPGPPTNLALSLHNYANFLFRQGQEAQAESMLREALAIREKHFGPDAHGTLSTKRQLGIALSELGKLDDADALLTEVLATTRRVMGQSVDLARSLGELAEVKRRKQDLARAETLSREAIDVARPLDELQTLHATRRLANVMLSQKKYTESAAMYREFIAGFRKRDSALQGFGGVLSDFGQVLMMAGEPAESETILREAAASVHSGAPGSEAEGKVLYRLGQALAAQHKDAEAEPIMAQACALSRASPQAKVMLEKYAQLLDTMGEREKSASVRAQIQALPSQPAK